MSTKGLYIHIPFSDHITGHTVLDTVPHAYVQYIFEQIPNTYYDSIYIGGGNLLKLDKISLFYIFEKLPSFTHLTVEINPHFMEDEKINIVPLNTRICLGVQKGKNAYDFEYAMKLLRQKGFNNISLEIPYGIENQTLNAYVDVLNNLVHLNPDHISIHPESEDEAFYDITVALLTNYEYEHYEYVSFCKENKKSQQTLIYSQYVDYDAVGLGSTYKKDNIRYTWSSNYETMDSFETEPIDDVVFEYVMMHLHLKEGMHLDTFKSKFGLSVYNVWCSKFEHEDLKLEKGYLSLRNLKYLDTVLIHFLNT